MTANIKLFADAGFDIDLARENLTAELLRLGAISTADVSPLQGASLRRHQ